MINNQEEFDDERNDGAMLRRRRKTRLRHDEAVYGGLWKRGIQRRTNRHDERVLRPGRQAGYDENDGIYGEV